MDETQLVHRLQKIEMTLYKSTFEHNYKKQQEKKEDGKPKQ